MFRAFRFIAIALTTNVLAPCALTPPIAATPPPTACAIPVPIWPTDRLYLGADDDAHATRFDPADGRALFELDRRLRANPDDVDARIARGYAHARRGERALSAADFQRARELAAYRTRTGWSEGWALWSLGDPACAIDAWQRAGSLQGGDAFWLPYTLAMGYWAAGEKDIAVAYYFSAARSMPQRFGTLDALDAYTQHWAPEERHTIHEIAIAAYMPPSENSQPALWFPWLR